MPTACRTIARIRSLSANPQIMLLDFHIGFQRRRSAVEDNLRSVQHVNLVGEAECQANVLLETRSFPAGRGASLRDEELPCGTRSFPAGRGASLRDQELPCETRSFPSGRGAFLRGEELSFRTKSSLRGEGAFLRGDESSLRDKEFPFGARSFPADRKSV